MISQNLNNLVFYFNGIQLLTIVIENDDPIIEKRFSVNYKCLNIYKHHYIYTISSCKCKEIALMNKLITKPYLLSNSLDVSYCIL